MKTELKKVNMLNDSMFKAVFRSIEARRMVASFLNGITGIPVNDLINADYQGGELSKKNIKEKGKTSDIIIKIEDNKQIILECNQQKTDELFVKNTSYAFSIISETIPINAKASKNYPHVILVNIDDFNAFKTKRPILHFQIQDEEGHIESEIYNSFHLIIENAKNSHYNINKEVKKVSELLKMNNVDEMKEKFKGDDDYMAAIRKVEDLSTNPNFVGYYDIEEARRQDKEDMKNTGIRIGMERGIKQGENKRNIAIARNLRAMNMKTEDISKATGLSVKEIENILKEKA
jgi:predicted transposase/invertase (TIGR01784 family)